MESTFEKRWDAAIYESRDWGSNPQIMRAHGSSFHKFLEAYHARDLLYFPSHDRANAYAYFARQFVRPFQIFVVQHDWAAAFRGAEISGDARKGEDDFRLPYPDCLFEFEISGKRFCISCRLPDAADGDECQQYDHIFAGLLHTTQGWMVIPLNDPKHYRAVLPVVQPQVRAVCIALDAEIAASDVIRAPHKLNRAREKRGKPPLFDYHTVDLSRRRHVMRLPPDRAVDDDAERRSVRLHFRRGHWRHFDNHKTWIKWTLVGDPDLGFIEKHYRL